ncbi:glycosyltransferase family protein [Geomonas anaerohicana]|uniref:Glycosyltransferase n=1 Tax=Geomonas anaerohicana TaxID=2798583 RepID=A0ABS0YGK2_9BACT|nr:glycosyltransferase [Geomonas anaerohicana]MBJ6751453.1 glycosyltransferase [Geomonas anaerohicana]
MKVVLGYIAWSEYAREWHEAVVTRARSLGFDVEGFCLTPGAPRERYQFAELDQRWQSRDLQLVDMQQRLKKALKGADVFWNFNGANVHPAWLAELECLNVYGCFDDPEVSPQLSRPVAPYADACLIGNLSCAPLYESWGVRTHAWAPLAFVGDDFDPALTPETVLNEERPLDLVFFGEREGHWRRDRLDLLAREFPQALFHGRGWPGGYADVEQRRSAYRRARIGWNVHNGVGPVNLRFFALLASGVLQICDNKCRTGQVLALGDEVVGFDTIEECVELTRYYLTHEEERRRIAANGLRAYRERFTEEKIWRYYFDTFAQWCRDKERLKKEAAVWMPSTAPPRGLRERVLGTADQVAQRLGYQKKGECAADMAMAAPAAPSLPYLERDEAGGVNLQEKEQRAASGGFFEWPNMVALNWACTPLVRDARSIVELGCGTGCFAYEASADPARSFTCVDRDAAVLEWARTHRARSNVNYCQEEEALAPGRRYDLVVSIDVIEHVGDYNQFLELCCSLADRALLTTPNKRRNPGHDHDGPPEYYQHVREWSAGEFYWVLRCYYREVRLYALPDLYVPQLVPVSVTSKLTPLVAECRFPLRPAPANGGGR